MATPARDDFYARGVDIGQAPMEGYDTAQSRDYLAQDRSATLAGKAASTRNVNASAAESEFKLGRQQISSAAADSAAAAYKAANPDAFNAPGVGNNATAVPGAPASAALPSGTSPTAPAAGAPPAVGGVDTAGAAAPAPGAATPSSTSSEYLQRSQVHKLEAYAEMTQGNFDKANEHSAQAFTDLQTHIFNQGAALGSNSAAWDKASKLLNTNANLGVRISKDKNGVERLNVTQPDGTTTAKILTETDKRNLMGAQALIEAGSEHMPAALGIMAKVDGHLATEVQYRNKLAETAAAGNNKGYGEVVGANAAMLHAQALMERNQIDRTKQSFGQPVKVLDADNKPIWVQPTMTNGKMAWEKADLPDGAHFPNQKDVSIQKTANGIIATDTLSGKPLYRTDTEGNVVPIEPDPWAGKSGMVDQSKVADWENKGVVRGLVHRDDGSIEWGYTSKNDPQGQKFSTPQEALAAGQTQKPPASTARPWPLASAGRGLSVPSQPPTQDPRAAAEAEAEADRFTNYRDRELARSRQRVQQARGVKTTAE